MEHYNLKENEVVLHKATIKLKNKQEEKSKLILTNLNLIFITKQESYSEEKHDVQIYPINEIKIYKEKPQIKKEGNKVEIYFLHNEIEFEFFAKGDLNKFLLESTNLLTNKTPAQRGADKVKNAIKLIDDTLGIDSVHAVENVIKNGVVGKGIKTISKFVKK